MSVAPAPASIEVIGQENGQAELLKNMVLDPGWFDGNQIKFEDWQRGIRLFLKSNRVIAADKRITAVLAQLRGGIAGIYIQKKINKLENTNNIKIIDGGFHSFLFSFLYFTFLCLLFSIFYFQNNLGQGLSVTPSHQSQFDGIVTRLITGFRRMKQKVLE